MQNVLELNAIIQRTLHEATGLSEQEASEVWAKMHESPFRKLIQYELEKKQALELAACATATPEHIFKQQGIAQGLQIALGILARKDPKSKT